MLQMPRRTHRVGGPRREHIELVVDQIIEMSIETASGTQWYPARIHEVLDDGRFYANFDLECYALEDEYYDLDSYDKRWRLASHPRLTLPSAPSVETAYLHSLIARLEHDDANALLIPYAERIVQTMSNEELIGFLGAERLNSIVQTCIANGLGLTQKRKAPSDEDSASAGNTDHPVVQ